MLDVNVLPSANTLAAYSMRELSDTTISTIEIVQEEGMQMCCPDPPRAHHRGVCYQPGAGGVQLLWTGYDLTWHRHRNGRYELTS